MLEDTRVPMCTLGVCSRYEYISRFPMHWRSILEVTRVPNAL